MSAAANRYVANTSSERLRSTNVDLRASMTDRWIVLPIVVSFTLGLVEVRGGAAQSPMAAGFIDKPAF
jgi:hypothetical protein